MAGFNMTHRAMQKHDANSRVRPQIRAGETVLFNSSTNGHTHTHTHTTTIHLGHFSTKWIRFRSHDFRTIFFFSFSVLRPTLERVATRAFSLSKNQKVKFRTRKTWMGPSSVTWHSTHLLKNQHKNEHTTEHVYRIKLESKINF